MYCRGRRVSYSSTHWVGNGGEKSMFLSNVRGLILSSSWRACLQTSDPIISNVGAWWFGACFYLLPVTTFFHIWFATCFSHASKAWGHVFSCCLSESCCFSLKSTPRRLFNGNITTFNKTSISMDQSQEVTTGNIWSGEVDSLEFVLLLNQCLHFHVLY